jgi:hypothetical protein
MTDETKIKSLIFDGLLCGLTHQESLFIIDTFLRQQADSIYEKLSVEEMEEILLKYEDKESN